MIFRAEPTALLLLVTMAVATAAHAAPITYSLTFGSLPSAQGMSYQAAGVHAATIETNVYAVHGDALQINSLAEPYAVAGGSALYAGFVGQITTNETKRLRVTARCLQYVGTGVAADGRGGFGAGFATGATQFGFSVTPTQVFGLASSGWVALGGAFDNATEMHNYRLEFSPPSTQHLYRDDVLLGSTEGFPVTVNRLYLGDATGGANAQAEVRNFAFEQVTLLGAPIAEGPRLELRGAARNPSPRAPLDVVFTLPAAAPAELELLDVSGRRLQLVEVGVLGAGTHVVRLDAPAGRGAGVFWIRLAQGGEQRTRKVVVLE